MRAKSIDHFVYKEKNNINSISLNFLFHFILDLLLLLFVEARKVNKSHTKPSQENKSK